MDMFIWILVCLSILPMYRVRGVVVVRLWKGMSLRYGCEMYEYVR